MEQSIQSLLLSGFAMMARSASGLPRHRTARQAPQVRVSARLFCSWALLCAIWLAPSAIAAPFIEITRELDNPYTGDYQHWMNRLELVTAADMLTEANGYSYGFVSLHRLEAWSAGQDPAGYSGRTTVRAAHLLSVQEQSYLYLPVILATSTTSANNAPDAYLQAMVTLTVEVRPASSGVASSFVADQRHYEEWAGGWAFSSAHEIVMVDEGIEAGNTNSDPSSGLQATLRIPLAVGDNLLTFELVSESVCASAQRPDLGCMIEAGGYLDLGFAAAVYASGGGGSISGYGAGDGVELVSEPATFALVAAPILWFLLSAVTRGRRWLSGQIPS